MNIDAQHVVAVTGGVLRGGTDEGVTCFRGVPFGCPPTGPLRFHPPQTPDPWKGVRDATRPAHASYQSNNVNLAATRDIIAQIDPGVTGVIAGPPTVFDTYCHNDAAEDCLYLDVWVPDSARRRDVPVLVYYHGGANIVSSGSFELERAATLAREANVIVVRPNYRLGALGWVHFGLLDGGLPDAVNLGLQDQFAALAWVHENIAAFGGDPENVTIAGESAGATAVSHLLSNSRAHGYFRRAILQSFSPFNPWCTQQPQEARFVAETYLELLKISDPAQLMTVDPNRLLAGQSVLARYLPADAHVAWRPQGAVVDPTWSPSLPAGHLSHGAVGKAGLEVIIGFAKDEWQFFRGHTDLIRSGAKEDVSAFLSQVFGAEGATALWDGYRDLHPRRAPGDLLAAMMSFEYFKLPSFAIAHHLSNQGVPVRLFQFSYDLPGTDGRSAATHTGDMPFLWRNLSDRDLRSWPFFEGVAPEDLPRHREDIARVGAEMGTLYASFMHAGQLAPRWPAFTSSSWNVFEFGKSAENRPNLLKAEWDIFDRLGFADPSHLEEVLTRNTRNRIHGG
jgi:para-nitrobenzyl esterase